MSAPVRYLECAIGELVVPEHIAGAREELDRLLAIETAARELLATPFRKWNTALGKLGRALR
jgi:hypothetical protein